LRKHTPKDIKQEKHQRDKTLGASPAKRAKSDLIEIDDFDLDDEDNIEDFDAGNLDLKVSPLLKKNSLAYKIYKVQIKKTKSVLHIGPG
jgi:hypothetical protein